MTGYLLRRLGLLVPTLLGVSVLVFSIMHLIPGDPVMNMLGDMGRVDRETVEQIRENLGLNDPLYVQYLRYVGRIVRGDLGRSILNDRSVTSEINEQLPSTLQLAFASMGIAILGGGLLGIIAALRRGSWVDNASIVLATTGVSMPDFWLGLLLIIFFSVYLRWIPVVAQGDWRGLILPSVALGARAMALIARTVRSSMLEVLHQGYIVTARAKGLPEAVVTMKHAMRNALIPVVTIVGLQFGALLGGAMIIETVFARQGVGRLVVRAILEKDYPLAQGAILVIAVGYVLVNLMVDLLYGYLDPRIHYGGTP